VRACQVEKDFWASKSVPCVIARAFAGASGSAACHENLATGGACARARARRVCIGLADQSKILGSGAAVEVGLLLGLKFYYSGKDHFDDHHHLHQ
jgi:hypothetical protein